MSHSCFIQRFAAGNSPGDKPAGKQMQQSHPRRMESAQKALSPADTDRSPDHQIMAQRPQRDGQYTLVADESGLSLLSKDNTQTGYVFEAQPPVKRG